MRVFTLSLISGSTIALYVDVNFDNVESCVGCWTTTGRNRLFRRLNDFARNTRPTTRNTSTSLDAASRSRGPRLAAVTGQGRRGHGRQETGSAWSERVPASDRTRTAESAPDECFRPIPPPTASPCELAIDIRRKINILTKQTSIYRLLTFGSAV